MPKRFPGKRSGHLAFLDDELSVHQEVIDAEGVRKGLGESRDVADPLRVEDDDVGRVAYVDPPPLRRRKMPAGRDVSFRMASGRGMTLPQVREVTPRDSAGSWGSFRPSCKRMSMSF